VNVNANAVQPTKKLARHTARMFPSVNSSSNYTLVPVITLNARESASRLSYAFGVMTTVATVTPRAKPGRSVVMSFPWFATWPLTKFKLEFKLQRTS
jgi:hypothetical protein